MICLNSKFKPIQADVQGSVLYQTWLTVPCWIRDLHRSPREWKPIFLPPVRKNWAEREGSAAGEMEMEPELLQWLLLHFVLMQFKSCVKRHKIEQFQVCWGTDLFSIPTSSIQALREAVLSPAQGNRAQILPRSRAQWDGHSGTGLHGLTGSIWGAGERDQEQRERQGGASEGCRYSPGAGKDLEMVMGFVEVSLNPALCMCGLVFVGFSDKGRNDVFDFMFLKVNLLFYTMLY